jgi:hypothetical protein
MSVDLHDACAFKACSFEADRLAAGPGADFEYFRHEVSVADENQSARFLR